MRKSCTYAASQSYSLAGRHASVRTANIYASREAHTSRHAAVQAHIRNFTKKPTRTSISNRREDDEAFRQCHSFIFAFFGVESEKRM